MPAGIGLFMLLLSIATAPAWAESLRIGGTGGAMGAMDDLAREFSTLPGPVVATEVEPSLGTSGGLRALAEGAIELAVVGRPLTAAERGARLRVVVGMRTLYVLASPVPNPPAVAAADVARLFADVKARWPDGTPVRPVLRPEFDTDYFAMFRCFPGTEAAIAALRRRDDVPTASTDQDNQEIAARLPGALISTTLTQIITERRGLGMLAVDGVAPSAASLVDGSYFCRKPLWLVAGPAHGDAVTRFVAFVRSPAGRSVALRAGLNVDDE